MRPAVREALLYGSAPPWLLPGLPTFQMDWDVGRLWLNGIAYYDEASIIGQFSSFSTPSHYETDADGVLQLVGANRLSAFVMTPGKCRGQTTEEQRTNVLLWNRDLTQATAWTAVNVTATKDQTGADGVANSASKIVATAGNGTILQTVTLASSARFQTAYVKRITGTGAIQMTMDGGLTWTAVTVTSAWTRVSIPTQTLANPVVGFRIVTSGDAIAVDFVQNENGTFATSPIATTNSQVTRAASTITRTLGAEFNPAACSLYAEWITSSISAPSGANEDAICLDDGSTANRLDIYREATTAFVPGRVTAGSVNQYGANNALAVGANTRIKALLQAKASNFLQTSGGVSATAGSTGSMPSGITTMRIGRNSGGNYANGPITRTALWNTNNVSVPTT